MYSLKRVAQEGNIEEMYNCIREERRIGETELIDTPLHEAADKGHVDFALAMMYLNPSWGSMLNQDFHSPMHLAVRNEHKYVVFGLLAVDKDLVRVKGKEGFTALHYAAEKGGLDLLAQFLQDCPACIEDVTIRKETALHIAANMGKVEALEMLGRFLYRTHLYCSISKRHILDSKDSNGDTVLHIAARHAQSQMIELLLECEVNTKEINNDEMTALQLLERQSRGTPNREICLAMMLREGQKNPSFRSVITDFCCCYSNQRLPASLQEKLRLEVTSHEVIAMRLTGKVDNAQVDKINALLVVLALIITATYQTMLSPPGGVWQGEYSANTTSAQTHVGQSVMDADSFVSLYVINFLTFLYASVGTMVLLHSINSRIVPFFEILLSMLMATLLISKGLMQPTTTPVDEDDGVDRLKHGLRRAIIYMIIPIVLMEFSRRLLSLGFCLSGWFSVDENRVYQSPIEWIKMVGGCSLVSVLYVWRALDNKNYISPPFIYA